MRIIVTFCAGLCGESHHGADTSRAGQLVWVDRLVQVEALSAGGELPASGGVQSSCPDTSYELDTSLKHLRERNNMLCSITSFYAIRLDIGFIKTC